MPRKRLLPLAAIAVMVAAPAYLGQMGCPAPGVGTVLASVVDTSSVPVPQSAGTTCSIPALSMTGTWDPVSERFVFNGVPAGQYTVMASASGYGSGSALVDVYSLQTSSVTIVLTEGGGPPDCGSTRSASVYAACLLIILLADTRRRAS